MSFVLLLALAAASSEAAPPAGPIAWHVPAKAGAMAPWLHPDGDGLLASWIERGDDGHVVRTARMAADGSWSAPSEVVRSPQLLANWADTPAVVRGGDGALYVAFPMLDQTAEHAYHALLARSVDEGLSWSSPHRLNDDQTATEHGFVSMAPVPTGVEAFWLDGRAVAEGGPMSLRMARVGEQVAASREVDGRTCSCCNTTATTTPTGVLIAYRDRADDRELRDITVVRHAADELAITAETADGWIIAGCPVNGPALATHPGLAPPQDGQALVHFTAADGQPVIKVSHSTDGGQQWTGPSAVVRADASNTPLGRVTAVWAGSDVIVTWLAARGELGVVRARRVDSSGQVGPVVDLGFTTPERKSGFPRAAVVGDQLHVVWTTAEGLAGVQVDPSWVPAPDRPAPQPRLEGTAPATAAATAATTRPVYSARTPSGEAVSLPTDRPVLVNLWATWCGPCLGEGDALAALHAEAGETVAFIGVAIDDSVERVRRIEAPYPLVVDDGSVRAAFGLTAVPTTLVYAADGRLVWSREGPLSDDEPELRAVLKALR